MNQIKKHKKGRIVIPLAVIIGIVLILFCVEKGAQHWLNKQLPTLLNENPHRKYEIHFEKAKLNFYLQKLNIEQIVIEEITDSTLNNRTSVASFSLEKPNLKKLFFSKEIETQSFVIQSPDFEIVASKKGFENNEEVINDIWKDVFTRLNIKNLEIKDASLVIFDSLKVCRNFTMSELNIVVKEFNVDTTTIKNPFPISFNYLNASCGSLKIRVDTIGVLSASDIHITNETIGLNHLSFLPNLSVSEFLVVNRDKNDWISFDIGTIGLNKFSWEFDEIGRPVVFASTLQLDSLMFNSVSDKQFLKENRKVKPLLSELFRMLPLNFKLDSFKIAHSSVCVKTRPFAQDTIGILLIDQLFASGYNLHNMPDLYLPTEFDVISRLMGEAQLKANFKMDVNDSQNRFQFSGEMENLTTGSLNTILEPLAGIETAGQLYGLKFNILADDKHSDGTVDFEYDGLKVKVLRANSSEKNIFLSTISNVALRRSNIASNKKFKQGEIDFQRDNEKSMFGFIWDSVKDGLLNTIVPFDLENKNRPWNKFKRRKS